MTIARLASIISYDLQEYGYTNITYSTTLPSYQSGYRVVAVRKCTEDYHLMNMYSSSIWRHKPAFTHILQYNYSVPYLGSWTNEGVINGYYFPKTLDYDSEIYYIKYKL